MMRRRIAIALVVVLALGALLTFRALRGRAADADLVLSGTIEADDVLVGSRVGGRVAEVLVREGDRVSAGQPLVRFESADLDARRADAAGSVARAEAVLERALNGSRPEEIAEARAQTQAAAARLELARNGPRREEVEQARAQLASAEADFELARADHDRIRPLAEGGVVPRRDLDAARAAVDRARGLRDAARDRLELLLAGTRGEEVEQARSDYERALARQRLVERGPRAEEIAEARAELARARASVERVETDLSELVVAAPSDAFVEVLQVRPGDLLAPGAPVATLVEVDRLWVRVYVPEPQLGLVALGTEVRVSVDTFPGESLPGRIEFIASKGEFTPRNVQTREERDHQVFAVRVRLLDVNRLRAGMAADVTV
jgi:multidrug resistance efflux pump